MGTSETVETVQGSCLCGAVRFRLHGPLRGVVDCHCGQCRKTHGHFAAYTSVDEAGLEFLERRGLKWFCASPRARRGFCGECGASLFWQPVASARMAVAAGVLDAPTGLRTEAHIYTGSAGDYYELPEDGLPRYAAGLPGPGAGEGFQ